MGFARLSRCISNLFRITPLPENVLLKLQLLFVPVILIGTRPTEVLENRPSVPGCVGT